MSTNEITRDELSRRGFTSAAQRVVRDIGERALVRGMRAGELTEATAGMLAVLSIVRWERKLARAALEHIGVDLSRFGQAVDDAIEAEGEATKRTDGPQVEIMPSGQRKIIVDLRPALNHFQSHAENEARALGNNWVGTEHLLLAAISTACPRFRPILEEHEITHDKIKQALADILAELPKLIHTPH